MLYCIKFYKLAAVPTHKSTKKVIYWYYINIVTIKYNSIAIYIFCSF